MQDEHETENAAMIPLGTVALERLTTPFLSQWTYGAAWSQARILISKDGSREALDPPDDDVQDLKFEIHYRDWFGIAYFGFGQKSVSEKSLKDVTEALKIVVTAGMSAADAVRRVIGAQANGCVFRECVFGVANAWLENPRLTVPPNKPFTLAGLGDSISEVKNTFAGGTANPIMCEMIDSALDVWLALQISDVRDGAHFVEIDRARNVLGDILRLS